MYDEIKRDVSLNPKDTREQFVTRPVTDDE